LLKFAIFAPGARRNRLALGTAALVAVAVVSGCAGGPGHSRAAPAPVPVTSAGGASFITKSVARAAGAAKTRKGASPSARPKAGSPRSTGPGGGGVPSPPRSAGPVVRSPYTWPFAWNSVWNLPIAVTAAYAKAGIASAASYEDSGAADYDSVNPSFPVVSLRDARLASGHIGAVSVYGDPGMSADGKLNTCSAFLGTDKTSVYQGQTTQLAAGGNPSFGGALDDASLPVDITGAGTTGCHGGSGLSGLGGTLTLADVTQSGPISHALKVALDGVTNYSGSNRGFRWPAVNADNGYNTPSSENYYGRADSNVQEGSLLALPRSINPASFSNPTVARIARAMQHYGAYVVDTTATAKNSYSTLIVNYNAAPRLVANLCVNATPCGSPSSNKAIFSSQLDALFRDLDVVTNNTAATPGGGAIGAGRCAPYAPPFTGGSGAPPPVSVVSC
jgi:hypothetical protein